MPHTTTGLNPALDYSQGWYRMTCILKEGNVTAQTGILGQNGEIQAPTTKIASAISKGDLVSLSTDTANTASATGGAVVVTTAVDGANFGRIATKPRWVVMPSSSQTVWATMLAGDYYRIAEVWIDCTGAFDALTATAGSTAVSPGDALVYDASDDGWVQKISGGFDIANSDVWDLSGADTGANGMIAYAISAHYSDANTGHVLAFKNLVPWVSEA